MDSEFVLRELLSDERLKGWQFYTFKEYKNANGDRILGGHAALMLTVLSLLKLQGADLNRAVHWRHLHQTRDSYAADIS